MAIVKVKLADLRCKVNIHRKSLTADNMGGNNITYTIVGTAWANISDWRGREGWVAERVQALVSHIVTVRATTDLQVDDVVEYNGEWMPVNYITTVDEGKAKYLQALCVTGDPTGPTN